MSDWEAALSTVRTVLKTEGQAILELIPTVGAEYRKALELLLSAKEKVILTGIGKSGHVARKVAATLNSTGTHAIFLHPSEAVHGDLGVLTQGDVVIAYGKSGESEELIDLIPHLKKIGTRIIAITANRESRLAKSAEVVLWSYIEREACPLDLAPTASTAVSLAIGDALAMALMKLKGFRPEDFALFHPGGQLGHRLQLELSDLLIPRDKCPVLKDGAGLDEVIEALDRYSLGVVLFSPDGKKLSGILTDGDLRRMLKIHGSQVFEKPFAEFINRAPKTLPPSITAAEALRIMESHPNKPLNVMPIVENQIIVGLVRLHELVHTH